MSEQAFDINQIMHDALAPAGYGCSEAPFKPEDHNNIYITWEAAKEKISYASGSPRFLRQAVNVVIWIPDGTRWHEPLQNVRSALTDAGLPNSFEGMSYVPEANRKSLLVTVKIFREL